MIPARFFRRLAATVLALGIVAGAGSPVSAARLKDIASIGGERSNPLIGYGLVVGLKGTGDSYTASTFTMQSIMSMLQKFGVSVPLAKIQVENAAAVMVTADLPVDAKRGGRLDVVISSLGDAASLEGGTLLLSPLLAANGEVYAVAQGPVLVGAISASGQSGSSAQKNHPTVGRIPGGGVVEREVALPPPEDTVRVLLARPDFTTAARTAEAINRALGPGIAEAKDAAEIRVQLPETVPKRRVAFLSKIEEVEVAPDAVARVVVNERTGTVVIGQNVKIATVALAHGSLHILIREAPRVSQPPPFSRRGETVVTPSTEVEVQEEKRNVALMDPGATISDLVGALNKLGVTPRDLIAILQALKEAGALQAELAVM